MTERNSNLREKYLDGEALFRKYWQDGDSRNVKYLTEWAITNGMVSSRGHNPTVMGVWKAMWRWASLKENKEKAFRIANEYSSVRFDWEIWKRRMLFTWIPSAWQHPTIPKKERFLRENEWI